MAPQEELVLYPTSTSPGLSGGLVATVVLVAMTTTAFLVLWGYRTYQRRVSWSKPINQEDSYTDEDEGELELEEIDVKHIT